MNTNKILQDKINTQLSTTSKIQRPSDDPVIAIRALRLRTNLSEIEQYTEKNIPDAKSWLDITASSLENMSNIMEYMETACTKGSAGDLSTEDREKILQEMINLREEVYATGDSDYAGRNLFTGYRTDTKLSFQYDSKSPYEIIEQLTKGSLDTFTYVDTKNLSELNADSAALAGTVEGDIKSNQVTRIRLAYEDLKEDEKPSITVANGVDKEGNKTFGPLQVNNADVVIETMPKDGTINPYTEIANHPNKVYYVPETGELLMGAHVVSAMDKLGAKDELRITYRKEDWKEGDLRPEHYFATTSNVGKPNEIKHNESYLTGSLEDADRQVIAYDVGFNQDIRVNTLASDVFTHDIGRDMDLITEAVEDVAELERVVDDLTTMLKNTTLNDDQKKNIQYKLDAANKALELTNSNMQLAFENGITKMQEYMDITNTVITDNGSRIQKLELITNRLDAQQTSFTELEANNNGIDVPLLTVQLSSVELSFQASLLATGKIIQNSLLNFL